MATLALLLALPPAMAQPTTSAASGGTYVPILMYHYVRINPNPRDALGASLSVTPANFQAQMAYLARNQFHVIPLGQAVAAIRNNSPLPSRPVVLTFDDGYTDFWSAAVPAMRRYGFTATSYIIPGRVGLPSFMTWSQIHDIDQLGFTMGAHTIDHVNLRTLPVATALWEMSESKRLLERQTGHPVIEFNWPDGGFTIYLAAQARAMGFESSVSEIPGAWHQSGDLWWLQRQRVSGSTTLSTFSQLVGGPWPGSSIPPGPAWPFGFRENLGGRLAASPAASSSSAGALDAFVQGTDNQLWYRPIDSSGRDSWQPLGGVVNGAPAAVSWDSTRIDVFTRGADLHLWHRWRDANGWSQWESLGGVLASAPTVASWGPGRLDVFVRGTDHRLWQLWYDNGGWQGWSTVADLGAALDSAPAAVSWGFGRLDIVMRAQDDRLWHLWYNGTAWNGWETLGGAFALDPAVTSSAPGHLDLLARGADGLLWHRGWNGQVWTPWTNAAAPGFAFSDSPSAAATHDAAVQVLVRGTDDGLWHVTVHAN